MVILQFPYTSLGFQCLNPTIELRGARNLLTLQNRVQFDLESNRTESEWKNRHRLGWLNHGCSRRERNRPQIRTSEEASIEKRRCCWRGRPGRRNWAESAATKGFDSAEKPPRRGRRRSKTLVSRRGGSGWTRRRSLG
jgi:hypothetical protein